VSTVSAETSLKIYNLILRLFVVIVR